VRKYKRKHARNPDKRMAAAVRLRDEGLSLRQIGERLACSEITVRRDLARWQREHSNVTPLRHSPATFTPPGGKDVAPECRTETNVIEMRRKA
jgi:transposase